MAAARVLGALPAYGHRNTAANIRQAIEDWLLRNPLVSAIWGPNHQNYLGNNWVGAWYLGHGSYGLCGLWVRLDANQNVVDRMVVKACTPGHTRWNLPDMWPFGNPPAVGVGPPREAHVHFNMRHNNNHPRNSHILRNFAHWVHPQFGTVYKLYLQYVSHQSLDELIKKHIRGITSPGLTRTRRRNILLPEPFCWYLFESLATAAVRMLEAFQRLPLGVPAILLGPQVIHQDMKYTNVLLDAPDSTYCRCYPVPYLSDFGGARVTTYFDNQNPGHLVVDESTDGFWPPEHPNAPDNQINLARERNIFAANIWQIGMIMLSVVNLTDEMNVEQPDFGTIPAWAPTFSQAAQRNYSLELRELIESCLVLQPFQRPDPRDLLRDIQGPAARVRRFRQTDTAAPNDKRLKSLKLKYAPRDKYRVGKNFSRPPPQVLNGRSTQGPALPNPIPPLDTELMPR